MKENRLLINCAKYCKSEGLFYVIRESCLFVCVKEQFIMFLFGDSNKRKDSVLKKNGGRIYRPPTLENFVEIIGTLQGDGK